MQEYLKQIKLFIFFYLVKKINKYKANIVRNL